MPNLTATQLAGENPFARSLVWTAWVLLTHCLSGAVVVGVMVFVVPRFSRLLEDFGMEMSSLSMLCISAARFVAAYGYVLLPVGLAVDAIVLFGLSRLPAEARWLGIVWATLVPVAAVALLAVLVVGLFRPLLELIDQLK
jgi:hypothetical protein